MIRLVMLPLIVIASHLNVVECTVAVLFPSELGSVPEGIDCHCCGTRVVIFIDSKIEVKRYFLTTRDVSPLCYFITDAPHDDAGVVAVATHHKSHILHVVTGEILAVVIAAFRFLPLVEHLIDDKHAKAITSIEESLCGQVVAAPHSIVALCFQQLHLMYLRPVDARRTQESVVMMHTASIKFSGFAIQQKALFSREMEGTDTEGDVKCIFLFARLRDIDFGGVSVRVFK